jgi:hypothetical protein
MGFLGFTRRDAEHIIDGGLPPGRADLDGVRRLAAFMRATSQVEPPPPMSTDLYCQIVGVEPATA